MDMYERRKDINSDFEYLLRWCIIITIVLGMIFLIIPSASADITWNQQCSLTVHANDKITCGTLQISNIQFSSPVKGVKDINKNIVPEYTVTPSIIFNTNFEKQILLTDTDTSYIEQTNKSIRIDVSGFPDGNSNIWIIENYNPSATLTIYTRQLPQISLSLTSDQSVYEDGKDKNINITLSIENKDTEQFKPIRIIFNRNGLNLSKTFPSNNQKDFTYCCITPNQILSYTYNLEVPDVTTNTTYSVNATIKLQDPEVINKMIDYNVSIPINIIVIPQKKEGHVMVIKFIQDRFYTNDNVSVIITVSNIGAYSLYGVVVDDVLPNSLYPLNSSQRLHWYIPEIKANDGVELSYKVYPVSSGTVNLPVATMSYSYLGQNYQTPSNQVSTNVINNPFVKLRVAPTPTPTPIPTIQAQQATVPKPSMVAPSTPASQLSPQATGFKIVETPTPQTQGFLGVEIIGIILIIVWRIKR